MIVLCELVLLFFAKELTGLGNASYCLMFGNLYHWTLASLFASYTL